MELLCKIGDLNISRELSLDTVSLYAWQPVCQLHSWHREDSYLHCLCFDENIPDDISYNDVTVDMAHLLHPIRICAI